MAVALTTQTQRSDQFNQMIIRSLQYWQDWLEAKIDHVTIVDRERDKIVKSISLALELDDAWLPAHKLIVEFSSYMERRGYWDIWNWVLSQAVKIARRLEDVEGGATLSALFARLLRRQSYFRESTIYYRRAIRMSRQIEDHYNEARACTNLGYYYIDQGYWHRGEVLCCHALTLFEQLDNDHGRAHTENHLGLLYTFQCLWDKARRHLERACAIWKSVGDNHGLTLGYMNLGKLFYDMECANEALAYQEKALKQAELTGDENTIGLIHLNLGSIHRLRGNLTQAELSLRQAETIFRRFSSSRDLAFVQEYLGVLYIAQQKWAQAILHLETALEAWRNLDNQYSEIRTLIALVEYEVALKNQPQASLRLKEALLFLDQYDPIGQYCQLRRQLEKVRAQINATSPRLITL